MVAPLAARALALVLVLVVSGTALTPLRTQAGSRKIFKAFELLPILQKPNLFLFKSPHRMTQEQVAHVFSKRLRGYPKFMAPALAKHLVDLCWKYQFDPAFILSLIRAESAFKNTVVSHAGAVGLMQVMPETAKYLGKKFNIPYKRVRDLKNPFINMELGITYLYFLRKKYSGSLEHFLAAYNAGPGRVDKAVRRNRFRPRVTKPFIEKIRYGVPGMRMDGQFSCTERPKKNTPDPLVIADRG